MNKFERELNFKYDNRRSTGTATVYPPVFCPEENGKVACWYCTFELAKISPVPGKAFGEDSIDAFLRALKEIRSLIQKHDELGYSVWWQSEGDHGGFVL